MEFIIYTLLYIYLSWSLYVLVMGFYRAKLAGRLKGLNLVLAYPLCLIGYAMDIFANLTLATVLFWEPPREWLVTERLQRYMAGKYCWRKRLAKYICDHVLDPFDPSGDHC